MSVERYTQEADANQARASDPASSAWVSANAGTGKTTVLVNRVLRLLLHKDPASGCYTWPETILCLTYTKAAAAEMETRLFDTLARWAVMDEADLAAELKDLRGAPAKADDATRARQLFAFTLDTRGGLKIHTIHAFCERLLHRFPLEAGVQADFAVLEDQERRDLRDAAIEAVLDRAVRDDESALGDALREVAGVTGEENFRGIVDAALASQQRLRAIHAFYPDPERVGEAETLALRDLLGVAKGREETTVLSEMAAVLSDGEIERCLDALSPEHSWESRLIPWLEQARGAPDDLRWRAFQAAFLTGKGKPTSQLVSKTLRAEHPGIAGLLEAARDRFHPLACEHAAIRIAAATGALVTLADAIIAEYETRKRARAALDYDDLIVKTAQLLTARDATAWVLYKLDYGIDHILVDEAQDTSPDQWRVIDALAEEFFAGESARERARTLFAVGDEKQSIYSFQGAAPREFATRRRTYRRAAEAVERPLEAVPLTVSFRSTEAVLESVDAVFARPDAARGLSWDGQPIVHQAVRSGQAGLVEVWPAEEPGEHAPVPAMRPQEEQPVEAAALERLVERIARTIRGWLDNGEKLQSQGRDITPGDILILVRTRDPLTGPLIRALKAKDIPVAGADRLRLTEHLAVMDLMAVGDFLLMPDDDLTLATVLKSPLMGLDDDDLFNLAFGRPGSLWRSLRENAGEKDGWRQARDRLERWLARADYQPPYEFFAGLLEENRMAMRHALIARLGPDSADAIDEFLNLALDYDRTSPPSLQGFLDRLRRGEAEVKRDMEQGRDAVRVMTVHGAKGLEADVVILPDTCRRAGGGSRPRLLPLARAGQPPGAPEHVVWVPAGVVPLDKIEEAKETLRALETEEDHRLLYVAMTRARDRLYICGWQLTKNRPEDCWYDLIFEGLKDRLTETTDAEGRPVWRAETPQDPGIKPETRETGTPPTPPQAPPEWARRAAPREEPAGLPVTPSAIAAGPPDETGQALAEQDVLSPAELAERSRFLRGSLVHALLQHLPELTPERREAAARAYVNARGADLDADTRAEIVAETLAVLDDPEFAALFGPGSRAEVAVAARLEREGAPALEIAGQIDRLVVRDNDVLIVDYKTNRPAPERDEDIAPGYVAQLAAYRAALRRVYPDKRVRAALLWTDGPRPRILPDEKLDEAEAGMMARAARP